MTAHRRRARRLPSLNGRQQAPRIERVTFVERIAPREMQPVLVARRGLGAQSRRDFLLYGAGAALAAAGFWWVLPEESSSGWGRKAPQ